MNAHINHWEDTSIIFTEKKKKKKMIRSRENVRKRQRNEIIELLFTTQSG